MRHAEGDWRLCRGSVFWLVVSMRAARSISPETGVALLIGDHGRPSSEPHRLTQEYCSPLAGTVRKHTRSPKHDAASFGAPSH